MNVMMDYDEFETGWIDFCFNLDTNVKDGYKCDLGWS